jgi:hypothetical protein
VRGVEWWGQRTGGQAEQGVLTFKTEYQPVPCTWYWSLLEIQSGRGGHDLLKDVFKAKLVVGGRELEIKQGGGLGPTKLNTSAPHSVSVPVGSAKQRWWECPMGRGV